MIKMLSLCHIFVTLNADTNTCNVENNTQLINTQNQKPEFTETKKAIVNFINNHLLRVSLYALGACVVVTTSIMFLRPKSTEQILKSITLEKSKFNNDKNKNIADNVFTFVKDKKCGIIPILEQLNLASHTLSNVQRATTHKRDTTNQDLTDHLVNSLQIFAKNITLQQQINDMQIVIQNIDEHMKDRAAGVMSRAERDILNMIKNTCQYTIQLYNRLQEDALKAVKNNKNNKNDN